MNTRLLSLAQIHGSFLSGEFKFTSSGLEALCAAIQKDQIRTDAILARQNCFALNMENCGAAAAVAEHAILEQLKQP